MTSLFKKAALSLALFFSGTLSCADDNEYEFNSLQRYTVGLRNIFAQYYNNLRKQTSMKLFLAISCQEKPLKEEDIEFFLKSEPFQIWLKYCNHFWSIEKTLSKPVQKSWANYICNLFVDHKATSSGDFVFQLKLDILNTPNDVLIERVKRFLILIMNEINRIYCSLKTKPEKDAFKRTIQVKTLDLIIKNLIYFATPVTFPKYYARRRNVPGNPTIIFNMDENLTKIHLEYIENGVNFIPPPPEEAERFFKKLLAERDARRTASGGPAAASCDDSAPSS